MAHKNKSNISPFKQRNLGKRFGPGRGAHKKPEKIYDIQEANDRLADIFRNHDFDGVDHEQRLLLAKFYRSLMENQLRENFTRLVSLRDVAIRHFIDSLLVIQHCELKFPLLDVGTGPGFPGIPLKIVFPDKKIILAEGVQKRVSFLKQVREELNLPKLEIIGRNINSEFQYPVNGAITRAVEDIANTLGNVINALQVGGQVYLMKGPGVDPEIAQAQTQWGTHYSLTQDVAYEIPKTPHKRRLLVFTKTKDLESNDED